MNGFRAGRARAALAAAACVALAVPVSSATAADAGSARRPTAWSALNQAIHRIPTYRPGAVRWVVTARLGYWGTTDWYRGVIYVDPSVPRSMLDDVVLHEWSHELSVLDYGGDVARATRAMRRYFGGHGLTGAERAADCMAVLQGADWTHYTPCKRHKWRHGARRLVRGHRLPRPR